MRFIQRIRMPGLLSFPPDMEFFELQSLNVLIGPNASGKSNFIEALELLRATPTDFAGAVRDGGGAGEWLWKGRNPRSPAEIAVVLGEGTPTKRPLRYRLRFTDVGSRVEVVDEAIEEIEPTHGSSDVFRLRDDSVAPDQSMLAQRTDPDLHPEVAWVGRSFEAIQTFHEWTALALHQIEQVDGARFNDLLGRFFPRFRRMSTRVSGGAVQFYLHESDFPDPIPATRLSDGTIRFVALLAALFSALPPRLACIEHPELGLHPDAVALLADVLVEASERMQLVVTTHSDALVSALTSQPDAIIACERPGAGTQLRRLDPRRLATWLEEYPLGDVWRMGELGANP